MNVIPAISTTSSSAANRSRPLTGRSPETARLAREKPDRRVNIHTSAGAEGDGAAIGAIALESFRGCGVGVVSRCSSNPGT